MEHWNIRKCCKNTTRWDLTINRKPATILVLTLRKALQMTKADLIQELVRINIESMDYEDLVELASEKMMLDMSKLSKAELEDQYEYVAG